MPEWQRLSRQFSIKRLLLALTRFLGLTLGFQLRFEVGFLLGFARFFGSLLSSFLFSLFGGFLSSLLSVNLGITLLGCGRLTSHSFVKLLLFALAAFVVFARCGGHGEDPCSLFKWGLGGHYEKSARQADHKSC